MRARSPSWRRFGLWTAVVALWAATPVVIWCPKGLGEVCAAAITRCTPAPSAAMPRCADAANCPMARAGAATCPLASGHCAIPFEGRLCFGDPPGGAALLAHAPQVHPVREWVAVLAIEAAEPRAIPGETIALQRECRPPPGATSRRPPARAPPAGEWT